MQEPASSAKAEGRPSSETPLRVAAAVVVRDGELLLTQRPPGGPLGLLWELPGGKIEPGESPERALEREIAEELRVAARPLETMEVVRHRYPHGLEVEIAFLRCRLDSHSFSPGPGVHDVRWWPLSGLDLDQVLAGDREFLSRLRFRYESGGL